MNDNLRGPVTLILDIVKEKRRKGEKEKRRKGEKEKREKEREREKER